MGWCHEFGMEIEAGCGHPMVAGPTACSCAECGTFCKGRFEDGCEAVWLRGPRPNAPGRPANYVAKAMFESTVFQPTAEGLALPNGASPHSVGVAAANGTAVVIHGSGPGVDDDMAQRLAHMEAAIVQLSDEVARQSKRQTTMEQHLSDLGKVLGQLGFETDDRLALMETVLKVLTSHTEPPLPLPLGPEPQVPTASPSVFVTTGEPPASPVVLLRPVSDEPGSGDDVADASEDVYRAQRSP